MPAASFLQSSFIGGLVSKWTQGRYHDQHYRTWMAACLNGIPVETEAWTRRPGFGLCGPTRKGLPGRLIRFSFQETAPYTMEFTDGHLRFWQANLPATTNDSVGLSSISAANPAVLALASAVTWATGDEVFLTGLGTSCPTLQNRRLTVTKIDTTHFSIADAITGGSINGSGIGTPAAAAVVNHVLDLSTVYTQRNWLTLRSVQTDGAAFFLHSQFAPYELVINSQPTPNTFATFGLSQSIFQDGPYLDPVPGSTITPGATSGITSLTLGFQAYSATQAYTIGAFVSSGGIGYQSLQDANVNNTPASSPTFWKVVGFGAAINSGQGFIASDIGRLVRLFSEPALWASGTTYASGALVTYNPSNIPGAETYYQSLANSNLGNVPGTDATHWQLLSIGGPVGQINNSTTLTINALTPALWTWGKITALSASGAISGSTGTNIGNMGSNGGLSAAFDGVTSKSLSFCAALLNVNPVDAYIGKNYTSSPTTIAQAVVYPSNDSAWSAVQGIGSYGGSITVNLFGSNSAPSFPSNGTLLATATIVASSGPLTLVSNNTVSTWNYVWIEITYSLGSPVLFQTFVAQVTFYTASAPIGTTVQCEILGPPLLYSGITIQTWRLGLYSNTSGWPNVGTYSDGRLWLASAAFPNRIDACVANGISGINNGAIPGYVNFAPTDQYGNVSAANGIAYTFNAPDANPIFWMIPDQQGILCGTQAGEWLVAAPTTGGLSPLNISARRVTLIGCANVEPRRTEHTVVFVQRFLRKIVEYFADIFSGKFSAPNLAKDAKQLTIGNLQELAYQQELCPVVWARVNNGLIGTTYKRDTLMTSTGPTMNAWHQHIVGGNNARNVTSIAVGSAVNGTLDALMAVTVDANNVNFVEVITPILDEGSTLAQAQYLDEAVVPTSFVINGVTGPNPYGSVTLNGLWNLNGYTVTAWLGGLDCGDYTVSSGSITVPFGDGIGRGQGSFPASSGANRNDQGLFTQAFMASGVTINGTVMFTGTIPMLVGNTYTSTGMIVRAMAPQEAGTRSGPAFGKLRRIEWAMMQVEGTGSMSWGVQLQSGQQDLAPVPFRQPNGTPYTIDQQFTGTVRDNLLSDYDFDNLLMWQVTRPFICNVQTIGGALETQDL